MFDFFIMLIHSILEFLPVSSSSFLLLYNYQYDNIYLLHFYSGIAGLIFYFNVFKSDIFDPIFFAYKHKIYSENLLKPVFFYLIIFLALGSSFFIIKYLTPHLFITIRETSPIYNIFTTIFFFTTLSKKPSRIFYYNYQDAFMVIFCTLFSFFTGASRLGSLITYFLFQGYSIQHTLPVVFFICSVINCGLIIKCTQISIIPIFFIPSSLLTLLVIETYPQLSMYVSGVIRLLIAFALIYKYYF